MKNNNISPYILCSTPELARQVLEKIERESDLRWKSTLEKPVDGFNSSTSLDDEYHYPVVLIVDGQRISWANIKYYKDKGITNFTKAEDYLDAEQVAYTCNPKLLEFPDEAMAKEEFDKIKKYLPAFPRKMTMDNFFTNFFESHYKNNEWIIKKVDWKEIYKLKPKSMTNKTWETIEKGDILIDEVGDEHLILGTLEDIYFLSEPNEFKKCGPHLKLEELDEEGYKIKGSSEDKPSIDGVIELLSDTAGHYIIDQSNINKAIEMLKKLK